MVLKYYAMRKTYVFFYRFIKGNWENRQANISHHAVLTE